MERRPTRQEFQADFSGGANPVSHVALLEDDEVSSMQNLFPKPGGGLDERGGFKLYDQAGSTDLGTGIFEMDQSTGTILVRRDVPNTWADETMQSRYELFPATPRIQDAVYFGAREKFNQLIINLVLAFVPGSATQGLVYEYWNGSAWTDFTVSVVGTADDKKLASSTLPREVVLSWPTLTGWTANQVDSRSYQFWIRIRVTVDLQAGGSNVVVGQRRVRGGWVGRRLLITTDTGHIWDVSMITSTARQVIETWPTGQRIERTNGASINDYFYYAGNGQRPLRRWNGCRGPTGAGGTNSPVDAGLTGPSAAPTETRQANAAAYPAGYILRYRLAFEYGPESILGESPPSPSREIAAVIAAGGEQVTVNFSAAVTQAIFNEVSAILIYATYNVAGITATAERDQMGKFLLIKRVLRDDATWNAGAFVDTFVARSQRSPIAYTNTPPFRPRYVVSGGDRLWIGDDIFVAWSDIQRGDSWDPVNIKQFPNVRGILYHRNRLFVFHDDDISTIILPPVGLPEIGYFWRGLGCTQPDTICVFQNEVHFVSRDGPARIIGNRVELTAKGRTFEDTTYWGGVAPHRRLASAAGFDGRVWFTVDSTGAGPGVRGNAALSLDTNPRGAWSTLAYNKASGGSIEWATFGVVHATLDHPRARELLLCAFSSGAYASHQYKLAVLEYGTTDDWTTLETDGTKISLNMTSRALTMRAADRYKEFLHAHLLIKFRRTAASGVTATAQLVSNHGRNPGRTITHTPGTIDLPSVDFTLLLTEGLAGKGAPFRDTAPSLFISATTDTGFALLSWMARAQVEEFKV